MRQGCTLALAGVIVLGPAEGSAQEVVIEDGISEPTPPPGTILAPYGALELQFNAGYAQPFGELSDTIDMGEIADAGFTGGGALAWRLDPTWAAVGYGGFGHWAGDDRIGGGKAFGGAGGLAASIHFNPYRLVDPVLQLGAGYRLFFVAPGDERDNHMFHGFQVLKADFVVDFRITKDFALGPMLSADLNVLPWDLNTTTGTNSSVNEPRISTFFFAGVAGRHDLLGTRVALGELSSVATSGQSSTTR